MLPVSRHTRPSATQADDNNSNEQSGSPTSSNQQYCTATRPGIGSDGTRLNPVRPSQSDSTSSRQRPLRLPNSIGAQALASQVPSVTQPETSERSQQIALDNYFMQRIAPNKIYFSPELLYWVSEAPINELEARHEAAISIENAYQNNDVDVKLENLSLTSLPDCIGELKNDCTLYLKGNLLNDLPPLPVSMNIVVNNSYGATLNFNRRRAIDNGENEASRINPNVLTRSNTLFVENLAEWALDCAPDQQRRWLLAAHKILTANKKKTSTLRKH